ncbi:MAG: transcriptional regulator [Chitinophagaceae bacterium]|nr:transcriptional regulator [Chitinophagaceae bacterium]
MTTLKYKVIKSKAQYKMYTNALEELVFSGSKDRNTREEMDLLGLLIEKYDEENNSFNYLDPVQLLQSLINDHNLKAKDLVEMLDISKGYVSDILHYKKGLSKEVIRKLSAYFKVSQEAFNRPYKLSVSEKLHLKNASGRNIAKRRNNKKIPA